MTVTQTKTTTYHSDFLSIINQATLIWEALEKDQFIIEETPTDDDKIDKIIDRWCQIVGKGNWETFHNRLQWNGWTLQQVRQTIKTFFSEEPSIFPDWANTLAEIVETARTFSADSIVPSPLTAENPHPFEDILLPMIAVARQKLLKGLGSPQLSSEYLPLSRLQESAYLSLEQALLQNLSNLTAQTLEFEFSHSRPLGQSLLNMILQKEQGGGSKVQYKVFVDKLLSEGMLSFFKTYPVLARLISTAIDLWIEATAEFLERLETDFPEIINIFYEPDERKIKGQKQEKIIEINSDLSDQHHQGRSVIAITFNSGIKLIYKPKSLALEVTYSQFLAWCNQQFTLTQEMAREDSTFTFKVIKILNRDSYGWVEYIDHLPCADETAAKGFYRRAGMLLCLLYVLGGNDCHIENLVACGEHLVLVDMETVMHPEAKMIEAVVDESAVMAATNQLFDSVLRTGLLPMWEFGVDPSIAYDLSALGSVEQQPIPVSIPVWRFVNTDDMCLGYEQVDRPLQANIPMLHGKPLSPNDYVDDIKGGFRYLYHFFLQQREILLGEDSPLKAFCCEEVRFLFRPTKVYNRVLKKTLTPDYLRHGFSWSIELDILSRPFLTMADKPLAWPVLAAELKQIADLDVPYFSAVIDSDALRLGQEQNLPEYFVESSYDQVVNRLKRLNETDLEQQVAIIELAFYAKVAQLLPRSPDLPTENSWHQGSISLLTSRELIAEAEVIASQIEQRAIRGTDGSLSWISLTFVPSAERFQVMPIGNSLYDGNSGIALFFAALAKVTGQDCYRDLALKIIQPLQHWMETAHPREIQKNAIEMGIGGGTGLGSIVYSLVKVSEWLELPELLKESQRIGSLITSDLISIDNKYELLWGTAGTILGLLTLYQKTNDPDVLAATHSCGEHLLSYCEQAYKQKIATPKPLTGFSHGAAGIAYALLRLYAITEESSYLEAARIAIAYEDSFFYPVAGNWREILPVDDPSAPPAFWSTWCHGAPGISLGRLGGLAIDRSELTLKNVQAALQTTLKTGLQNIDHLCCGNMGRCEVMLVAAQKLDHSQWFQAPQELATQVVQRAKKRGYYQIFDNMSDSVFSPCFFQGVAGIGYQLLRLADPIALPSVLLWE